MSCFIRPSQAALQQQNGRFVLLPDSAVPVTARFNSPATFNLDSNVLDIPLAKAFGQDYQATLKHLGNYVFELKQAGQK